MRKNTFHIGTSGWSYSNWKPDFYPAGTKAGDFLSYYATQFSSVEINSGFYRLPPLANIARWRERTPEGFLFALKAWQNITHLKRLKNCADEIDSQHEVLQAFGDRLGPVLFQLPPSLQRDDALLDHFLGMLPKGYRYVVEFRHDSWLAGPVYDVLQKHKVALCQAHLREWKPAELPFSPAFHYLRLHGPQKLYTGLYGKETLAPLAKRLLKANVPAYVYFNNTMHGDALADVRMLEALLGESRGQ